jgi:hypothetical protein
VTITAFSCDSVSAYRPGSGKFVQTPCGLSATQHQQSGVTLPSSLTTITITQGTAVVTCPVVTGLSCIGDGVFADISGDTTGDAVLWTLTYDVTGLKINMNKLIVYHYNDQTGELDPAAGIPISSKNNCKVSSTQGCATLVDTTLTITVQTPGNGKVRLLG